MKKSELVEQLFLLTKHAASSYDGETIEDDYIRNWARWTVEETKDSYIPALDGAITLRLRIVDGAFDTSEYDAIYGEDAAAHALESEKKNAKEA